MVYEVWARVGYGRVRLAAYNRRELAGSVCNLLRRRRVACFVIGRRVLPVG